jgi:hypothetical protein
MRNPFAAFLNSMFKTTTHSQPWGQGKHRNARSGGGNTDIDLAKFCSRPLKDVREHHPTQAERNLRRNRRQRIAR